MDRISAAVFLKGRSVGSTCELMVVRDWDLFVPILLCAEPRHTREQHKAEVRRKVPDVSDWLEFNAEELDVLVSILPLISGPQRLPLRRAILDLKRSFLGRVLTEEQFRRAVDSPGVGGSGLRLPVASPPKTMSRNGVPAAAASVPRTSPTPKSGFAALLQSHSRKAASDGVSSTPAAPSTASSSSDGLPW